MQGGHR
ncbi:hypothetical protein LINPERPRIM_LOCUS43387 [Linum perenne]